MAESTQLLKGILESCVLKFIAIAPTYGYEIIAALKEYGFTTITEGTLYPILLRLEQKGAVTTRRVASPSGPSRKYYFITEEGQAILTRFYADWTNVSGIVSALFKEMDDHVDTE